MTRPLDTLVADNEVKTVEFSADGGTTIARMRHVLVRQRAAFVEQGAPSAKQRIDRLDRVFALLADHRTEICEAMAADYVVRAPEQTLLADVVACVDGIKHAKKHLHRWMRPSRRSPNFPLGLLGAKAHVHYQPLGVVGNIVPWNFPVYLAVGPLVGILAAGNRAMIKMSEFVPHTAALLERLFAAAFDETEVAVFQGGPEVGAAFGALPFDHLFFTGSPKIGKLVMRAASENLTPVTLELGGKSPVVVGRSADLALVARRVAWGKTFNGGQVCLAPDYVLVPEGLRGLRRGFSGGGCADVSDDSRQSALHIDHQRPATQPRAVVSRRRAGQGRPDCRSQSGGRGFRHPGHAQDAADVADRSGR
jgi:coniferyl-aldehyde dehydrogenase